MEPAVSGDDRRRQLAAIHAAAAKLGMDTSDRSPSSEYRSMLAAQGGVVSAADLDEAGRRRVLRHLLRSTGTKPPRDGWQAEKMRRLWSELGQAGKLADPSERGLNAFVKSQTGMASPRFLPSRDANRVIEALKAWLARPAR